MKVAQLSCVWPPYGGGMGQVAFWYAKILSGEHQVTVFTPRYGAQQSPQLIDGVEIKFLNPAVKYGNAVWLPQLPRLLKGFDVVHLHYPFFGVHEFIKLGRGQKLIVNYHMLPRARGLASIISSIDGWVFEKRLRQQASAFIVSSQDFGKAIVKPRLGSRVKMHILPFGVSDEFSLGSPKLDFKNRLGIKPGEKIILFVGGLDSQHYFKGLPVLLKALLQLIDGNYKLVIVGEGNLKANYQAQVKKLGLVDKVFFAGQVARVDLPDYYRLADVFVLPSINNAEAFGLVTLEAMGCGVPAVVTNLPGPRSLVQANATGLVARINDPASLANKIDLLLSNDELRYNMGIKAARLVGEQYRWSKIGPQLLKLYREL